MKISDFYAETSPIIVPFFSSFSENITKFISMRNVRNKNSRKKRNINNKYPEKLFSKKIATWRKIWQNKFKFKCGL